jgi:starch synthase
VKILLATSEIHPWSKTGGLADMTGAHAKFLARAGHEVVVVTPLYAGIKERVAGLKLLDWKLNFPMRERMVRGEVWSLRAAENLRVLFIHQPDLYYRAGLYSENGAVYQDNADRFIYFAKAVVNLARYLPFKPDLVHAHDWQAGLVPLMIRHQKQFYQWHDAPATCLTIHNLAYQGNFPWWDFGLTNLPFDYFRSGDVEFHGTMSCLKAGIVFADMITTVSPRYAREITEPELGCAMDGVLRARRDKLAGILNGVDYDEWNTTHNPFLPHPFSSQDLRGKQAQKAALQAELGLPVRPGAPLFGSITRLAEQKGLPIELSALEEMLAAGIQFTLLGSGDAELAEAFLDLARRHPEQVAVRIGFDQELSHRIEAGCDFYLMPSRFEPCGLNQMYSLRYGTIPIVRATGGLDDSVVDATEETGRADGIKFQEYSPRALAKAIRKALALYAEPELLEHYRQNGMTTDFSWERTVRRYEEFYRRFAPARAAPLPARPAPAGGPVTRAVP